MIDEGEGLMISEGGYRMIDKGEGLMISEGGYRKICGVRKKVSTL